jgi:hypothetical protein
MAYSSEPPIEAPRTSHEQGDTAVTAGGPSLDSGTLLRSDSAAPGHASTTPAISTKRTDVLRHVFPRPRIGPVTRSSDSRITKPEHRKNPPSSDRHSRRRVAFHKVLTSFFSTTSTTALPRPIDLPTESSASSSRSKAGSGSNFGSAPSIDFVSTGAFMFSGPSLRSHSGSFTNSTSRLPSLTENGSD